MAQSKWLLLTSCSVGWRAIFFVNGGLAALTAILGFLLFPADESNVSDKRIDWMGAGLITVGLVLLQYVLSGGEAAPNGWKTGCQFSKPTWVQADRLPGRYYCSAYNRGRPHRLLLCLGASCGG